MSQTNAKIILSSTTAIIGLLNGIFDVEKKTRKVPLSE
jgi:hypothetical protein